MPEFPAIEAQETWLTCLVGLQPENYRHFLGLLAHIRSFLAYTIFLMMLHVFKSMFLVIPFLSFHLRLGYPALLFIDTEVILFSKTLPLSRSRPDFRNPSPIMIDAVRGLMGGWVGGRNFNKLYVRFKLNSY